MKLDSQSYSSCWAGVSGSGDPVGTGGVRGCQYTCTSRLAVWQAVLLRAGLLQPVVPALVVVAAVSRRALMGL
jgi:hypothetical protein